MDQLEIMNRIDELEREITSLPPGSVSVKKSRARNTIITALPQEVSVVRII